MLRELERFYFLLGWVPRIGGFFFFFGLNFYFHGGTFASQSPSVKKKNKTK